MNTAIETTRAKKTLSTSEIGENGNSNVEKISTIVIGGGQCGLSMGYHLKKLGVPFVILDAKKRVGDAWRSRWDSLRLFTPARYNSLDGMPYPAHPHYFPTKDEMGDYLEAYAKKFDLPVRSGVKVDRLTKEGDKFIVMSGHRRFEADSVVVAMATFQKPKVPSFAGELDPAIVQMHSVEYKNPSQLRAGGVLLVGAGNSGSEIAMELSRSHKVWMSGRDTGHIPFREQSQAARFFFIPLVLRILFHRIFTIKTPIGRKVRRKILTIGGPLIRVKPKDLKAAGVERAGRTASVRNGRPVLEDGRMPDVSNVIWCTGFHTGFSWIDLPVHGKHEPLHKGGVVETMPGLFFTGLHFLYSLSSTMVQGAGRDAKRIARAVKAHCVKLAEAA